VALCHANCNDDSRAALFGEVAFPVAGRLGLEVRGMVGGGETHTNTGLAVVGRYHFNR
jgi:hypothetical protein